MLGEMYHELAFAHWDYASRRCAAVVLPLRSSVWVTTNANAIITSYAVRIGKTRAIDILEIYVDSDGADSAIPRDATPEEQQEYVRQLRACGWKVFKHRKV